jgi:16S rRNA (guanine527-N7)-methyltransferase
MERITHYFKDLAPAQLKQFTALKDLYVEWNQKINVISRKDMDHFYEHHVLHSLAIAKQFTFPAGRVIMDLGCGGGFPGIPLAILFPHSRFLLVDSIQKKLKVADAVAYATGLHNLRTVHARAEDLNRQTDFPPNGFDTILTRAVAPLKDLWAWSKPLLAKDRDDDPSHGLICLKGGVLAHEIAESGCNTKVWPIEKWFDESYFKDKYLLQVIPYL